MRGEETLNIASFHNGVLKEGNVVDQPLIGAQGEEVVAASFPMAKEVAFIHQCVCWGTGVIEQGELEGD